MAARGGFTSKLGFILAAAGSAVGLGNIWKFPFEVGAGGGAAFVLMYLLFCFVLCFPVMVTEIAIGRKTERNPVGAFKALGFSNWRFLGLMGVLAGIIILSFYNVIAGWAFGYFFEMVRGNFSIGNEFSDFTANVVKVGSYALIFMAATGFIVMKGVSGGVERAARFLMPALIVMILALVVYAITLPNAIEGVKFYLIPDWSKITQASTIGGALRQAFFSLSLGMGALITYGSYVGKKDNIISSAAYITLTDVGIAFIAGLMMFPLVAFNTGGVIDTTQSGPGLIFVTLPGVFENIGPTWGIIIGAFFFLLLSFAALTSTVSLLEVPVSYVVDEFQVRRKRAVIIMSIIIFAIGVPSLLSYGISDFFSNKFALPFGGESANTTQFLDFAFKITEVMLLLGGALITVFAAYVWKKKNLAEEITSGYSSYNTSIVKPVLNFCISFLCPLMLTFLLIVVILDNFAGINLIEMIL